MIWKLVAALGLTAACVVIHASGITYVLPWARSRAPGAHQGWRRMWLFVRIAAWIILFHLIEICVWAFYYWWTQSMPDLAAAIYFSAVTYTTTGYGDLTLPPAFRLVGGVEALTGILMCGWSTGFFVAVVNQPDSPSSTGTPTP